MKPEEMQQFPSTTISSSGMVVFLQKENLVNIEDKLINLKKELTNIELQISRLKILMSSEFASKAPAEIVEKEKQKLSILIETAEKIKKQLNNS